MALQTTTPATAQANSSLQSTGPKVSLSAEPYAFTFNPRRTALLVIDMQRDFLLKDGFGGIQAGEGGLDAVQKTISPTLQVLQAFRSHGIQVIHTREGHRADLRDLPTPKLHRQARAPTTRHTSVIGEAGPMGRLLVRGQYGHDIIDELQPIAGEIVIDKPGKGAFFSTSLHEQLADRGITHLIMAGVTVECCVTTTAREANDRGFDVCILRDCTDGYVPDFKTASLEMIHFSEGLFGFVGSSGTLLEALDELKDPEVVSAEPAWDGDMNIDSLRKAYAAGLSPVDVVLNVLEKVEKDESESQKVWIKVFSREKLLARAEHLDKDRNLKLPLYGIPFAVKDNIYVAGLPLTASCPFYSETPQDNPVGNAHVVNRLISAGAIVIGKTNLDQFATGLVGNRSPHGPCHSICSPDHISGGSSSGSALAVALGHVSFSLGTDTAGSGRIPAAFNGIVGLKPTKGTISTDGVVSACQSLDCVSIFARSIEDAEAAWLVAKAYDWEDFFAKMSRPLSALTNRALLHEEGSYTFAIPPEGILGRQFSPEYLQQWRRVCGAVHNLLGAVGVPFGFAEYFDSSDHDAAFAAERAAAFDEISRKPSDWDCLHPAVRQTLENGSSITAAAALGNIRRVHHDSRIMELEFNRYDVLIMPTAPRHPTIEEVEKDPVGSDLELAHLVSAVNILDLAAVALPAGMAGELPFGIQVIGPAFREGVLLEICRRIRASLAETGPE